MYTIRMDVSVHGIELCKHTIYVKRTTFSTEENPIIPDNCVVYSDELSLEIKRPNPRFIASKIIFRIVAKYTNSRVFEGSTISIKGI